MIRFTEHPFLADLPSVVRQRLESCASEVDVPADSFLFKVGESADAFYLVADGRVSLELAPPAGQPLVVETVDAGSAIGWSWFVPPHRAQFDARAATDVVVFKLGARCLEDAMAYDPQVAATLLRALLTLVAGRLANTRLRLLDLYGDDDRR
jgi:CRP/FNR family transcriptional regulator, cyclic AMP receptor protein